MFQYYQIGWEKFLMPLTMSVFAIIPPKWDRLTIHKRNLQKLTMEVYKIINYLNLPYIWDIFTMKVVEYDFEIKVISELPPARSQRFGTVIEI